MSNLSALRKVGFHANRRLLDVERLSHDCAISEATLERVHRPASVVTDTGLRVELFLPRVWARTVRPGLATVMPAAPPNDSALRSAFDRLERAMDDWCKRAKPAA